MGGKLDRQSPVDGGMAVGIRGGGVEDDDDLGHPERRPVAVDHGDQGMGTQEPLAFDRVVGRVGGDGLGEQLLGRGDEPLVELDAGLGVELPVEAPHAVAIDPGAHPAGSPLALQPGHPTVGLQLAELGAELTAKLLWGEHRGTPRDPRPLGDQQLARCGFTRPQHVADHVDMTSRHRPG